MGEAMDSTLDMEAMDSMAKRRGQLSLLLNQSLKQIHGLRYGVYGHGYGGYRVGYGGLYGGYRRVYGKREAEPEPWLTYGYRLGYGHGYSGYGGIYRGYGLGYGYGW